MVSIDQVLPTTGINNTAPASAPTSLESVVSNKIDPAVAGGFTALGIAIGVLLTALILYILSQCRRERNISSPRGNTSIDCNYKYVCVTVRLRFNFSFLN